MKKSKEIKPEKLALIELSKKAKSIKTRMMLKAKTDEEKLAVAGMTINSILLGIYEKQTGHSVYKTFKEWKDEGYTVNKGERSYRVWSAPRKGVDKCEVTVVSTGEQKTVEDTYKFWAMCCLFHDGQVSRTVESEVA